MRLGWRDVGQGDGDILLRLATKGVDVRWRLNMVFVDYLDQGSSANIRLYLLL